MKFSKKCVICIFVFVLLFVAAMTVTFIITGSEPEVLTACVFAFVSWESGALAKIKITETKSKKTKKNKSKENDTE